MSDDAKPNLPKTIFIVGDIVMVCLAVFFAVQGEGPPEGLQAILVVVCAGLGFAFGFYPFVREFSDHMRLLEFTQSQTSEDTEAQLEALRAEIAQLQTNLGSHVESSATYTEKVRTSILRLEAQLEQQPDISAEITALLDPLKAETKSALATHEAQLEKSISELKEKAKAEGAKHSAYLNVLESQVTDLTERTVALESSTVASESPAELPEPDVVEFPVATESDEILLEDDEVVSEPEAETVVDFDSADETSESVSETEPAEDEPSVEPEAVVELDAESAPEEELVEASENSEAEPIPAAEAVLDESLAEGVVDDFEIDSPLLEEPEPVAAESLEMELEDEFLGPDISAEVVAEEGAAEATPVADVVLNKDAVTSGDQQDLLVDLPPKAAKKSKRRRSKKEKDASTLIAQVLIGIGNKPYVRGEGGGLSMEKGVPMEFLEIGKWQWIAPESTEAISCRIYKNDEIAAEGELIVIEPGQRRAVSPKFRG